MAHEPRNFALCKLKYLISEYFLSLLSILAVTPCPHASVTTSHHSLSHHVTRRSLQSPSLRLAIRADISTQFRCPGPGHRSHQCAGSSSDSYGGRRPGIIVMWAGMWDNNKDFQTNLLSHKGLFSSQKKCQSLVTTQNECLFVNRS